MTFEEAETLASRLREASGFILKTIDLVNDLASITQSVASSPCPVEIRAEGLPALVLGREVYLPVGGAYRAIRHLVDVYPRGASRKALNLIAKIQDVSGALALLPSHDSRWAMVLRSPRGKGLSISGDGLYRLVDPASLEGTQFADQAAA